MSIISNNIAQTIENVATGKLHYGFLQMSLSEHEAHLFQEMTINHPGDVLICMKKDASSSNDKAQIELKKMFLDMGNNEEMSSKLTEVMNNQFNLFISQREVGLSTFYIRYNSDQTLDQILESCDGGYHVDCFSKNPLNYHNIIHLRSSFTFRGQGTYFVNTTKQIQEDYTDLLEDNYTRDFRIFDDVAEQVPIGVVSIFRPGSLMHGGTIHKGGCSPNRLIVIGDHEILSADNNVLISPLGGMNDVNPGYLDSSCLL